MRITINYSDIAQTRWYEYASRFVFGGAITAIAGIVADRFGPGVGGLFLAFPAIFPAAVTLIEKHQQRRKRQAGGSGTLRGRGAAAVDASGAALGSFGLAAFAVLLWRLLPGSPLWASLPAATALWLAVAVFAWKLRQWLRRTGSSRRPGAIPMR